MLSDVGKNAAGHVQEVKSIVSAKAKLSYIDKKAKDLNYPLYLIVLQFRGAELLRCDQL